MPVYFKSKPIYKTQVIKSLLNHLLSEVEKENPEQSLIQDIEFLKSRYRKVYKAEMPNLLVKYLEQRLGGQQ